MDQLVRCWILYTTRVLDFILEHLERLLMHTNLVWVLDVQSYLCSMLPRSSHCKAEFYPCFFPSNYAVLTALNTSIFCVSAMVYQTTKYCAGSDASEDRSHRCIFLSAAFHENTIYFKVLFIQMVHEMGIMWLVLQSFHQTP